MAHFGNVYDVRIDVGPLLERLLASGNWERVELDQYGNVWDPAARRSLDVPGIRYREIPMRLPEDLPSLAAGYDAAIVIGNRSGLGPPSKVFQYMTLPVPRVVLVEDARTDETARFIEHRPGWLAISVSDSNAAQLLARHVERPWTAAWLAPPAEDSWPEVAQQILSFLEQLELP
jgi:hypothetical protein